MGYNSGRGVARFIEDFGYTGFFIFIVLFFLLDYLLERFIENEKTRKFVLVFVLAFSAIILSFFTDVMNR